MYQFKPDNLDAFARLRVSNPETVFDSKQIFDKQDLFWSNNTDTAGAITHNPNQASTTLKVRASTDEVVSRQTYQWFNYQPGKSQLVLMTGILGEPEDGYTQRIGQFYGDNGLFFEVNSDGFGVVVRTKVNGEVVDNRTNQHDFNIDRVNGTFKSGVNLDLSKTQIFFFDYEWLGVGTVRFGVFVDGEPVYCHYVHNANLLDVVYMSTPNLPLRYEIVNDGTGSLDKTMVHICSSVITEGGRSRTGTIRGLNRADDPVITNNDLLIYPVIGLQFKAGQAGALVVLTNLELLCTSNAEYAWYILLSPTITGTAPTWENIDNSTLQYSFPDNTTTISGGTILYTGIGSDSNQSKLGSEAVLESDVALGVHNDLTSQQVFIGVQRLTGSTETFYGCLNFRETI